MKNFTYLIQPHFNFSPKRLVFAGEVAPPSPETFKAPDQKSDAEIASEVGPISPSQIASQAAARTGFIKAKYSGYTMTLAGLMPTSGSQTSGSQTTGDQTTATQTTGNQTTGNQAIPPQSDDTQTVVS